MAGKTIRRPNQQALFSWNKKVQTSNDGLPKDRSSRKFREKQRNHKTFNLTKNGPSQKPSKFKNTETWTIEMSQQTSQLFGKPFSEKIYKNASISLVIKKPNTNTNPKNVSTTRDNFRLKVNPTRYNLCNRVQQPRTTTRTGRTSLQDKDPSSASEDVTWDCSKTLAWSIRPIWRNL